jgi:hypothetical protein
VKDDSDIDEACAAENASGVRAETVTALDAFQYADMVDPDAPDREMFRSASRALDASIRSRRTVASFLLVRA